MDSDHRGFLVAVCAFCVLWATIFFVALVFTAAPRGPYGLRAISPLMRAFDLVLCVGAARYFGHLGWNLYRGDDSALKAPSWFPWRNDDGNPP